MSEIPRTDALGHTNKGKMIIVVGRARSGKTSFSEMLSSILGLKTAGTSKIVYEVVAKARGCTVADLLALPKEEIRPTLIDVADFLCDGKVDVLSEMLYNRGYRILDGIRREEELKAIIHNHECFVVYMQRDKGTVDDNFNILPTKFMRLIENNGTLYDLQDKASDFAEFYNKSKNLL